MCGSVRFLLTGGAFVVEDDGLDAFALLEVVVLDPGHMQHTTPTTPGVRSETPSVPIHAMRSSNGRALNPPQRPSPY
jgi:hypothetical protein